MLDASKSGGKGTARCLILGKKLSRIFFEMCIMDNKVLVMDIRLTNFLVSRFTSVQ